MISGETGTGQELFAQSIHNASQRKNGSFCRLSTARPCQRICWRASCSLRGRGVHGDGQGRENVGSPEQPTAEPWPDEILGKFPG